MEYLVMEQVADVNQAGPGGMTPLIIAAQNGHLVVVRYLIEKLGADFTKAEHDGNTILVAAAYSGHLAVLRYLVEELGMDVNQTRNNGGTALMTAASQNRSKVVAYLLRHGAKLKACVPKHGTAADMLLSFRRADGVPQRKDALPEDWLQRRRDQEVHRMQAGSVLWAAIPTGALAGTQD
jgi:ankyrin repeat protein